MINRQLFDYLINDIDSPEIVILTGPRRIGKTTLLNAIRNHFRSGYNSLYVDFTDPASLLLWENFSQEKIDRIVSEMGGGAHNKIIFFDEIQFLNNSGKLLKIFYDHFQKIKVFATGSSSFLLLQSIGESLAGRKKLITLYPLSLSEITGSKIEDYWDFNEQLLLKDKYNQLLASILVFGAYPGVFLTESQIKKAEMLREIADSFLFKDLLIFEHIKKPRILVELAKLLAYQIGSLVNPNELAGNLGVSRKTVLDYIDLLERFFIVQRIYPYEHNMRDVIRKQFKVYFFDLGIRNAIIGDFRNIEQRNDVGSLLENAVVMGLQRRIGYERSLLETYFWRDYGGKEIDVLLREQDHFTAIEVKSKKLGEKIPRTFLNRFPNASIMITDLKDAYRFCL